MASPIPIDDLKRGYGCVMALGLLVFLFVGIGLLAVELGPRQTVQAETSPSSEKAHALTASAFLTD